MKHTLRFKLTAAFLLIALLAFVLMGVFANIALEMQFKKYVIEKLEQKNNDIVATLQSRYQDWGNQWDLPGLENLGVSALGDGFILRISDENSTVIWDAMDHNSGMCAEILEDMADNMKTQNAGFKGGYTEKVFQITQEGTPAGSVAIGYYGPYFYTSNDVLFLKTLNTMLLLATAIAGLLAFVLGSYLAKRLSVPIFRVVKTTEQIAKGNYSDRISVATDTREITELTVAINALAETLGKQQTLRKRLTADVAHELRTPLANLQSHLEAMLDGIWEPDAQRLQSCHEETVRLSKIVSGLEALARYDGENLVLNKVFFDVGELIGTIARSFEKERENKNIALTVNAGEQQLFADKDLVAQMMSNLLSNALKYTPKEGRVEISTAGNAQTVLIAVKDTGIGISKEDLPHIFERFYRADISRSRSTGGFGIGLAIVKSLAEAHGGTISAISEPGLGSEFVLQLPRAPQLE